MKKATKGGNLPINPRSITSGEMLLIMRRRKGQTKSKAAHAAGATLHGYNAMEDCPVVVGMPSTGKAAPTLAEATMIYRRRKGILVEDFAKKVGCSAWWLTQMERGDQADDRLREYWGKK